ncbi:hypothetical protein IFR04_005584 [Cadophora malorum]|uniref:Uncharacterized protein n=1 Tax=Cadophora malorum TaxID=108018 RepID=A0A8H7TKK6_9HELO|nr:hypothetical protein IFR04_005584 [Cadophora malorum]
MAYSTSSNTPINGSADGFALFPNAPPPRTPAQVAADAALSRRQAAEFVADLSLPVVAPSTCIVDSSNTTHSIPTVARIQAAYTSIAKFDAAFKRAKNNNVPCAINENN